MQRALVIASLLLFPAATSFARASHSSSGDDLEKLLPIGIVVVVWLISAAINSSKKSKPISPEQLAQLEA